MRQDIMTTNTDCSIHFNFPFLFLVIQDGKVWSKQGKNVHHEYKEQWVHVEYHGHAWEWMSWPLHSRHYSLCTVDKEKNIQQKNPTKPHLYDVTKQRQMWEGEWEVEDWITKRKEAHWVEKRKHVIVTMKTQQLDFGFVLEMCSV